MMLDYFYGQSGELFAYFRIPKALFQDRRFRQLSTDARTLYGILLDRMSLSAKNSWVDEHGRVYIIYTVREVQESLCCAEHKAVKLFRELEQANLIERKRRGLALLPCDRGCHPVHDILPAGGALPAEPRVRRLNQAFYISLILLSIKQSLSFLPWKGRLCAFYGGFYETDNRFPVPAGQPPGVAHLSGRPDAGRPAR